MNRNFQSLIIKLLLYIPLLLFSLFCILPLFVVVSASVTDDISLVKYGYSIFPHNFTLSAYQYIFTNPKKIINAYEVTTFVTVAGTAASLLISGLLAYPLSRKSFKYRKFFSFYVFFTMLFNGGLVPSYIIVTQYFHLKNTIWVLILPSLVSAWYILLMRTFFSSIPDEIIESAKMDGIGEYRLFFKILVPLSTPIIATVGLFTSMSYWNDWFLGLLYIDNRSLFPLQYLLYNIMQNVQILNLLPIKGQQIPAEPLRMAVAVLSIGPIIFVYLFFQKYFVRGLVVGSVKG